MLTTSCAWKYHERVGHSLHVLLKRDLIKERKRKNVLAHVTTEKDCLRGIKDCRSFWGCIKMYFCGAPMKAGALQRD